MLYINDEKVFLFYCLQLLSGSAFWPVNSGSRMSKKTGSGSGSIQYFWPYPDPIGKRSKCFKSVSYSQQWLQSKFIYADTGSGMENIRIRDPLSKTYGSGKENIQDTQSKLADFTLKTYQSLWFFFKLYQLINRVQRAAQTILLSLTRTSSTWWALARLCLCLGKFPFSSSLPFYFSFFHPGSECFPSRNPDLNVFHPGSQIRNTAYYRTGSARQRYGSGSGSFEK